MPPRLAILLLCVLLPSPVFAQEKIWNDRLNPILKRWKFPSHTYGIHLTHLESGRVLFSHNGKQPFNPASTIKLLTGATALTQLGPSHTFQTGLFRYGEHICLKGGGDPSLVTERVWLLSREALRKGVKEIKGDLWLDATLFPKEDFAGLFRGDQNRAFAAPISSLLVNHNALTIYGSATTEGESVRLFLDPDLPLFKLQNQAKTRKHAVRKDMDVAIRVQKGNTLQVTAWGKMGLNQKEITLYRSIPTPELYAGHLFVHTWTNAGGTFQGTILEKACPDAAEEILQFPSIPLSHIVFGMNKYSNNVIAEMLLRAIGPMPTREGGLQSMKNWLKSNGISAPELVLVNASGLSRQNRIAAQTLTQIIRAAANDLRIGPEFLASLGIAGTDGTLRKRLADHSEAVRIRAKSGRLSNVVALAGVAESPSVGKIAYAFLVHPPARRGWDAQKMEEELLQAIIAEDS